MAQPAVCAHLRQLAHRVGLQPHQRQSAARTAKRGRVPGLEDRHDDAAGHAARAVEAVDRQDHVAERARARGEAGGDDRHVQVRQVQKARVRVPGAAAALGGRTDDHLCDVLELWPSLEDIIIIAFISIS